MTEVPKKPSRKAAHERMVALASTIPSRFTEAAIRLSETERRENGRKPSKQ